MIPDHHVFESPAPPPRGASSFWGIGITLGVRARANLLAVGLLAWVLAPLLDIVTALG